MDENPFRPIDHDRAADRAVDHIEGLILSGILSDGERLPGERELAEQLGLSRPVLREALKTLEARGLILARHGGGTYVAAVTGQVFSEPMAALVTRHPEATSDYLVFRREIEAFAAGLAAERATGTDRAGLARQIEEMARAHEAGDFEAELSADIALHNLIAEAAHNVILLHTLRALYRMLAEGVFAHRRLILALPGARDRLFEQHRQLVGAILDGDAAAARKAAEDHIDYVAHAADEARARAVRETVARSRQSHRDGLAARHRA